MQGDISKDYIVENNKRQYQEGYKCEICGKKFGTSLGDMERHTLLTHIQNSNIDNK